MKIVKHLARIMLTAALVICGCLVLLFGPSLTPVFRVSDRNGRTEQITIISHRGAGAYAPENSLSAVKAGLASVAAQIEIDIQQTKDHVLVLMHDGSVERTTNGAGLVKDLTMQEIGRCRIDTDPDYPAEKVPELEEVMQEISGKKQLIIEIKEGSDRSPGIEQRTVGLIRKYRAWSWCIVHSFNDDVLELIHELDSNIVLHKILIAQSNLAPLVVDFTARLKSLDQYDDVDAFNVNSRFVNRRLVERVHALHKKINVWTVNDTAVCNKLISLGVDGIITDRPNDILKQQDVIR